MKHRKIRKSILNRSLTWLLIFSLLAGLLPPEASAEASQAPLTSSSGSGAAMFSDIAGGFAEAQIKDWVKRGLIEGYPNGTFRPDGTITRAEFAALVNRAFGFSQAASASFPDVAPNAWYYKDIAAARAAGYIQGFPDGTFRPNEVVERQQAAVITARLLNMTPSADTVLNQFSDDDALPSWSSGYIAALVAAGILHGNSDGTFAPARALTRAEALVLLDRGKKTETNRFDKAGVYGPVSGSRTISGDAAISAGGITLQNTVIAGNLVLSAPSGGGGIVLRSVTVKGTVTITGSTGQNVSFVDSTLASVTANAPGVSVSLSGSSAAGFSIGQAAAGAQVGLDDSSSITSLIVGAKAAVTGTGHIGAVQIGVSGVTIVQNPDSLTLAPGVTATVNGKEQTGSGAATGGSGGGGGDNVPTAYTAIIAVTDALTGSAVSGVSVTIGSRTTTTDAAGQAVFSLIDGTYSYTAQASGYYEGSGTIAVNRASVTQAIALAPTSISRSGQSAVFGPSSGMLTIPGDFAINVGNITLQNTVIDGDLLLASSIGSGNVTLDHVTVTGMTTVAGGGSHSVTLIDCDLYTVTVDYDGVHVVAKGNTTAQQITIESGATLDASENDDGSLRVTIPSSVSASISVGLTGDFGDISINAPNTVLSITGGTIQSLNLGEGSDGSSVSLDGSAGVKSMTTEVPAIISGEGSIESATIRASGTTMEQTPAQCVLSSGVTAAVGGSDLATSYYRATFQVNAAGATVTVGATTVAADASGLALFSLPDGTYSYAAQAQGYQTVTGMLTVSGASVTQSVTLPAYDIIFQVTDRGTGLPVAGATVAIGEETETTDASGTAVFNWPGGAYSYTVQSPGYRQASGTISVQSASVNYPVRLTWKRPTDTNHVVFSVTDPDGSPVDGAQIRVGDSTVQTVAGQATVELPSGTYAYSVIYSIPVGALVYSNSTDNELRAVGTITVPCDTQYVTLSDTQPQAYPVVFHVTDAGSRPLIDASVELDGSALTADGNGDVVFTVANGGYQYTVTASGYQDLSDSLTVNDETVTQDVELTSRTTPVYPVSFQINGSDGLPLAGASVDVGGTAVSTDSSGQATFSLAAGIYGYTVAADGYLTADGRVVVTDAGGAATVGLQPKTYAVTFTAKDPASGKAVAGVSVTIGGRTVTTDLHGDAVIYLKDGNYPFTISATGAEANPSSGTATVSGAAAAQSITVTRTAAQTYPVTFVVTDASNAPIRGALVTIGGSTATTDANGQASISLTDGCTYAYRISARGLISVGSVVLSGAAAIREVRFSASASATLSSLTLSNAPNLTYNGSALTYDLSQLTLTGKDQFGADFGITGQTVTWAVVSGPATVNGGTLTITGSGTVTVTATIGAVTSNSLALTVSGASPVLSNLTLSGNPGLTHNGASFTYELSQLTLTGKDQFGADLSITGQTVTWAVVSGPAMVNGGTLTITGSGNVTVTATIGAVTSNNLALTVSGASPVLSSLTLSGSPNLTYNGVSFTYELSDLTLTGKDQFGTDFGITGQTVTWAVVSGPATVNGSTLTITDSGTVTLTATIDAVTSNNLALTVNRTSPVLTSLTLSNAPTLLYTGARSLLTYDLGNLTLTGKDQFGDPYDLSGLTVTWSKVSGKAYLPMGGGSVLTVIDTGYIYVTASIGSVTTDRLQINVTRTVPVLNSLVLSGNPSLAYSTASFNYALSGLTLKGYDQFGAAYSLANSTVSWTVGGDHAALNADGTTVTVTGAGTVTATASAGSVTSNTLSLAVIQEPARVKTLDLGGTPPSLTYDGVNLTYDLSGLTLSAADQYGNGCAVDSPTVSWTVSGPAAASGGILTVTNSGDITLSATTGGITSNSLTFSVARAETRLTSLTLSGTIPDLTAGGDAFDLSGLALSGKDQFGQSFDLTGQTVTWSVASGGSSAGIAAGTSLLMPESIGSGTVTATVGTVTGSALSFTVMPPTLTLVSSLDDATALTFCNMPLATGGTGPYTWTVVSGTLPPGLTLNSDGMLGGPLTVNGAYNFTVQVTDSGSPAQTATQSYTLNVVLPSDWPDGAGNFWLTGNGGFLPEGTTNVYYMHILQARGAKLPYTWIDLTDSELPPGLHIDLSTGMISGTPTQAGTFTLNFRVASYDESGNLLGMDFGYLRIVIDQSYVPQPLTVSDTLPELMADDQSDVRQQVVTGGSPSYNFYIHDVKRDGLPTQYGEMPNGIGFYSDGTFGGTTDEAGVYTFTLTVTDNGNPQQTITKQMTLTVFNTLEIASGVLAADAGVPFSAVLTASGGGGSGTYTWGTWAPDGVNSALPDGVSLAADGTLSGTVSAAGSYTAYVTVTDSASPQHTVERFVILDVCPALALTSPPTAGNISGIPCSFYLNSTGGTGPYTWSVPGGSLPSGLTLSQDGSLNASITGTPAEAGNYRFPLQVIDSLGGTAVQDYTLTIYDALEVKTAGLLSNAAVNVPYRQALTAGGGNGSYIWSLETGSLPSGLSLSPDGIISGTPTAPGGFSFRVAVQDTSSLTLFRDQAFSITVNPAADPLAVGTASLPAGTVNVAYPRQILQPSGGTAPYTWSLVDAADNPLPPGLSMDATGAITGTPTTEGTYAFTVKVTDSSSTQQTAQAGLFITVSGTLQATTGSLAAMTQGVPYSQTLTSTGGAAPYAWKLQTGMPGITLDSDGTLHGTPTTAGIFRIYVQVTDSSKPYRQAVTVEYTVTVNPTVMSVTTASLPSVILGGSYSQTLSAGGGYLPGQSNYTWSVAVGSLPDGLSMSSDGVISGIASTAGTFQFTVQASDKWSPVNAATAELSITVIPTLVLTTASLSGGIAGQDYVQTLTASGGVEPYTWSVIGDPLPAGLSLSVDGVLSGKPVSSANSIQLRVLLTDSGSPSQSREVILTMAILPALTLSVSAAPYAGTAAAQYYFAGLSALNGTAPYTWSIKTGTLPTGLSLNATTGVISGRPTKAGTYNFNVQVTDGSNPGQTATADLSLVVGSATLMLLTRDLPAGAVSVPYNRTLTAAGGAAPYTWSLTGGALPDGLVLSASTGVISGTPTAQGTFDSTIQAADSGSPQRAASASLEIVIAPGPLTIPSGNLTLTIPVNLSHTRTLAAIGGTQPYTWSVLSGNLPTGLSLSDNGIISGTPTATGSYWCNVRATDGTAAPYTVSIGVDIIVNPQLAVTTASLPATAVGAAYSRTLAAFWGQPPYTWSLAPGSQLPAGLTLNPSTGLIGGTISAQVTAGTYPFTVQVTDSASAPQKATKDLSITVSSGLAVTSASLPAGTINTYYSQALAVTGGISPYTWSLAAGSHLPAGLSLNPYNGTISGVPTAAGSYSFSVQIADSSDPVQTATATVSLSIASGLTVTTSELAMAGVNIAYSQILTASGGSGTYAWTFAGGSQLPEGLSLSSDGTISGTPTRSGNFSFTVQATDSASRTASRTMMIMVFSSLAVTTTVLPNAALGREYTAQYLRAAGGSGAYTWLIAAGSQLPEGLSLSSDGTISGTPTGSGSFSFTVQTTDAYTGGTATAQLSITVPPASTLQVNSLTLPAATEGISYSQILTVAGGNVPYSWTVSGGTLPAGMSLGGDGVLSGAPTTAGVYFFYVNVTDSSNPTQTATGIYRVTVSEKLKIVNQSLSDGALNMPYYQTLTASSGTAPCVWSLAAGSHLPSGLVLNSTTGVISGTPDSAGGPYGFTVQATDSGNPQQTAMATFSITIGNGDLFVSTNSLPSVDAWDTYNETLHASGGTGPYTWQLIQGSLPAGLALDSTTGVISGTPTIGAYPYFVISVTDSGSPAQTSSVCLSIWVKEALLIGGSLPAAGLNLPYSAALSLSGGIKPYTLSVTGGALPVGLSMDENGVISGTPTRAGVYNFTLQLTDSTSQAGGDTDLVLTQDLSITVYSTLQISSASLPGGIVGRAYSQTLTAVGAAGSYTWTVTNGSLPAGLTINSSTGTISGTPSTAGTYTFTVQAADSRVAGSVGTATKTVTIYPFLTITTVSLFAATQSMSYNQVLSASGGIAPYTFTVSSGSLPAGLRLNAATGAITGIPTAAGTGNFTVQVRDSGNPGQTATASYSITVEAALTVRSGSLSAGVVGMPYSQMLTAAGGTAPHTWTAAQGSLPDGLSLSPAGVISGTPTAPGTASFSVSVRESSGAAQTAVGFFSITINPHLAITNTSLAAGIVSVAYSAALAVSNGAAPTTWEITGGELPAGLALNSATGVISGTPTAAGASSFILRATDSGSPAQTATAALGITVKTSLVFSTTALSSGAVSVPYSQTLTATGGKQPYVWAIGGTLPPGLFLDASTGVISGTPAKAGSYSFKVGLADGNMPAQLAAAVLSITIAPAPLMISASSLPAAYFGVAYSQTLTAAGGTEPYTWSTADSLPDGLSLSPDGVISGTPTATGSISFTVQATDSSAVSASARLSMQVLSFEVTAAAASAAGTGFTLTLNPAVAGLNASNLTLTDAHGRALTIGSAVSTDGGASYQVALTSALIAGEPCALVIVRNGYQFNTVAVNAPASSGSPTIASARLDADGTTVILSFNKAIAAPPVAPAGFAVTADGIADAVTAVGLSSDYLSLTLTLANPVSGSAALLISYIPGSVAASDGAALAAIAGQTITNAATAAGIAAAAKAANKTAAYAAAQLKTLFNLTAQNTASLLLQAGYAAADAASALSTAYSADSAAIATIFKAAGLTPAVVASALASLLSSDAASVTSAMRAAGYDAVAVAGALKASLPMKLSERGGGNQDEGAAYFLFVSGYSAVDTVRALYKVFQNDIDRTLTNGLGHWVGLTGLTKAVVYDAAAQVYGYDSLASWAYGQYGTPYAAQVLKTTGVSSSQTCHSLKALDAGLTPATAAAALWSAGYALSDIGAALLETFNPTPEDMVLALKDLNSSDQIKDYLVTGMQTSASEMLQLMMHGPAYLPDYGLNTSAADITAFLRSHYTMDAMTFASVLYQAGWTEANGGLGTRNDGYGLNATIMALKKDYQTTTALQLINTLGGMGLSSLVIATKMGSLVGLGLHFGAAGQWDVTWTAAYRQAGYTATDLAYWCVTAGAGSYGNPALAIPMLKTTGYGLNEIVLALKEAFGLSKTDATVDLIAANLWSNDSVTKAVQETYSGDADPFTAVVQNMKAAGATATQVANTLRYTLKVTDSTLGITYLAQAGYNLTDVMAALVTVYYNGIPSRPALQQLNPVMQSVYSQQENSMAELLQALNITTSDAAIPALNTAGFSLYNIVQVLMNTYGRTAEQAASTLTASGLFGSQAITAEVSAVYVADPTLSYIRYLFGIGKSASEANNVLLTNLAVSALTDRAGYLSQAGYDKQSVLQCMFNNNHSLLTSAAILQSVYQVADSISMARELAMFYGTMYPDADRKYVTVAYAVHTLYPGLGFPDLAKVLRSAGFPTGSYQTDSIAAFLYTVTFGSRNDALAAILGSKNADDLGLSLESAYDILKNEGYDEFALLQWLVADGFSLGDISDFMGYGSVTFTVKETVHGAPLSGVHVYMTDRTAVNPADLTDPSKGYGRLLTGSDGTAVAFLKSGLSYTYAVAVSGYDSILGTVACGDSSGQQLTLALTPTHSQAVFQVKDGLNNPVQGALVTVADPGEDQLPAAAYTGMTNASGAVSFSLRHGTFACTVKKDGFELYSGALTVSGTQTETVTLTGKVAVSVGSVLPTGFTATFSPAVPGLAAANFNLTDGNGNPAVITSVKTTDGGATYQMTASLPIAKPFTLNLTRPYFIFTSNLSVLWSALSVSLNGADTSGLTLALSPAVPGLTAANFTLVDSGNNPVTVKSATTSDSGATYTLSATLSKISAYTLILRFGSFNWSTPVLVPPSLMSAATSEDGTIIKLTFDKPMALPSGISAGFTVYTDGNPQTISDIVLNKDNPYEIDLKLDSPVYASQIQAYYDSGTVRAADGALLAPFDGISVSDRIGPLMLAYYMNEAGSSTEDIASLLHSAYSVNMDIALFSLKQFYVYNDAAAALIAAYGRNYQALCTATLNAGYTANDFAGYLKSQNDTAINCAGYLKSAGATVMEVYGALAGEYGERQEQAALGVKSVFSLNDTQVAVLLLGQYSPAETAGIMLSWCDAAGVAAALMAAPNNFSDQAAAAALEGGGCTDAQVALVWPSACATPATSVRFLKAAGFDGGDLAFYLQTAYAYNPRQILAVLDSAGLTAAEMAQAISDYLYNCTALSAVTEMKAAGFAAARAAEVVSCAPFSLTCGDIAQTLNRAGFSMKEILSALTTNYETQLQTEAAQKGTDTVSLAAGYAINYYQDATYYGGRVKELVQTLKSVYGYTVEQTGALLLSGGLPASDSIASGICSNLLTSYDVGSVVSFLLTSGRLSEATAASGLLGSGVDADQVVNALKTYCPQVSMAQVAAMLAANSMTLEEAVPPLTAYYGSDPVALAAALKGSYAAEDIKTYLADTMHVDVSVMLSLMMTDVYGMKAGVTDLLSWLNYHYFDMNYKYNYTREEMVGKLYNAGWTEANEGKGTGGYGSNDLVNAMGSFDGSLLEDLAGDFQSIGLTPQTIANICYYYDKNRGRVLKPNQPWVTSLRYAYCTANDFAVWLNAVPYPNDPYTVTRFLSQIGFPIEQILPALKVVYNPGSLTAKNILMTTRTDCGWTAEQITAAMVYFDNDPIRNGISTMVGSGCDATAAAAALKGTYKIADALRAGSYLAEQNFEAADITGALLKVYYEGDTALPADIAEAIYARCGSVYTPAQILTAGHVQTAAAAVPVLRTAGFSLAVIAGVLKDTYSLGGGDVLKVLRASGFYSDADIQNTLYSVYDIDLAIWYIKESMQTSSAYGPYYAAATLQRKFGITDPTLIVNALLSLGFNEDEIFDYVYFHSGELFGDIEAYESQITLMHEVFGWDLAKTTDEYGPRGFSYYDGKSTYTGTSIWSALMNVYGLSLSEVAMQFKSCDYNGIDSWLLNYTPQVRDDALALLLGAANNGLGLNASRAIQILDKRGYTPEETVSFLYGDGYGLGVMLQALKSYYWNIWYLNGPGDYAKLLSLLKNYYDNETFIGTVLRSLDEQELARSYYALLLTGYTQREIITIMLQHRICSIQYAFEIVARFGDRTSPEAIANYFYDIAMNTPDVSISFMDICEGLMDNRTYLYGGDYAIFKAMESLCERYYAATDDDLRADILSLAIMRENGLSPNDASGIAASEGVGLKSKNFALVAIGYDSGWEDAVSMLVEAGYTFDDGYKAVMNNSTYRMMMTYGAIVSAAISGLQLSLKENIKMAVTVSKYVVRASSAINKNLIN